MYTVALEEGFLIWVKFNNFAFPPPDFKVHTAWRLSKNKGKQEKRWVFWHLCIARCIWIKISKLTVWKMSIFDITRQKNIMMMWLYLISRKKVRQWWGVWWPRQAEETSQWQRLRLPGGRWGGPSLWPPVRALV